VRTDVAHVAEQAFEVMLLATAGADLANRVSVRPPESRAILARRDLTSPSASKKITTGLSRMNSASGASTATAETPPSAPPREIRRRSSTVFTCQPRVTAAPVVLGHGHTLKGERARDTAGDVGDLR
jgi:hypothetical protein